MVIALYKTDEAIGISYYYIHTYQGHLFSRFSFTAVWGKNLNKGKEMNFSFDTKNEMENRLQELLRSKLDAGFKLLYSYPHTNQYENIFQSPADDAEQVS
jgi:predicted DNA-binding WGR domain protein